MRFRRVHIDPKMKQFTGGIVTSNNQIHLNLQIAGGKAYTRVYDNNISVAINKLQSINDALINLSIDSNTDATFYVEQIINLLQSSNVEFLYGSSVYQSEHNAKVLKVYLSHMIKKNSIQDMLDILGLTKIRSEINDDTAVECDQTVVNIPYVDGTVSTESLLELTNQIKIMFSELCTLITSKQSEIQAAYEELISNLNALISKQ